MEVGWWNSVTERKNWRMYKEDSLQSHHNRWIQFDLLCNLEFSLGFIISHFLIFTGICKVVMACGSSDRGSSWMSSSYSMSFGIIRDWLCKLFNLPIFPSFITIPTSGFVVLSKKIHL